MPLCRGAVVSAAQDIRACRRAAATAPRLRARTEGDGPLLQIYNSLTRRAEPFEPLDGRTVRMYVCGVTPYDVGHLGHARVFVTFDTVRRYMEFTSYGVSHIQNITDVDDDMVRKSRELGISIAELTERNQAVYLHEMDALNVQHPDAFPTVTASMDEIIAMVGALVDGGHAYVVDGHVFFESAGAPQFGALAGADREGLLAWDSDMVPDEPEELKRDPLDFLLWQPSEQEGASFPSPWGVGRPGWHIECSAMARAALGDQIDIHGGGKDLQYPHHDSEIAQSEAVTGKRPYVGHWMHVGTTMLHGEKMSKSLGNLIKVSELLTEGHTPDAIRLYLLGTHYREDQDFDVDEALRWEERATALRRATESAGGPPDRLRVQPLRNAFSEAMDADFDTPRAIEVLTEIASGIEARQLHGETAIPALVELAGVLGLRLGREG